MGAGDGKDGQACLGEDAGGPLAGPGGPGGSLLLRLAQVAMLVLSAGAPRSATVAADADLTRAEEGAGV
ncbi:hypothetical protein [Kitasatospora sp. NPDC056531]|uniref:hypothetical protein n=1 Tax=unclassified Kitasatospora TaxID=2633591 RepID=UPI0036B0975C